MNKVKIIGKWLSDRGYDAWDVFIGDDKWCRLVAITEDPVGLMLSNNMTADIDWCKVSVVKLT